MALPRAGHWGANCHLEGQKSNHSFFITYCFPSIPRPVFTLFLPLVVGSLDILWLLWFNCTLKLSAGISSCSFRKINTVSEDQIPWRSKSWTCSGALINFKLVWACTVLVYTEEGGCCLIKAVSMLFSFHSAVPLHNECYTEKSLDTLGFFTSLLHNFDCVTIHTKKYCFQLSVAWALMFHKLQ